MCFSEQMANRSRALGIALILVVGLLNFHVPHFLIEPTSFDTATYLLELIFAVNLIGALVAGVGIYRNNRWGWILGLAVTATSFALYLAQESVGLPGLPKVWWEPSRIVALAVETVFVVVARYQLVKLRALQVT
jgi:peptidoglycan/LPS O-acetylase OafA/YrhL